jgi:hypothetical protein
MEKARVRREQSSGPSFKAITRKEALVVLRLCCCCARCHRLRQGQAIARHSQRVRVGRLQSLSKREISTVGVIIPVIVDFVRGISHHVDMNSGRILLSTERNRTRGTSSGPRRTAVTRPCEARGGTDKRDRRKNENREDCLLHSGPRITPSTSWETRAKGKQDAP